MNDLQKSIALLFARKGKESLTEREFVFSASMDLRWFSPREAQRLLDAGISGGYLEKRNGSIAPTFDVGDAELPLDYKPGREVLENAIVRQPRDLFIEMVEQIARTKSVPKREVVSKVNRKQEMLGIDVEPAVLLVACDYGLRVDQAQLERAESNVLGRDMLAR
jgi:hypothetical protein